MKNYIIFDFDKTLAKNHLHNVCMDILMNAKSSLTQGKKDADGDTIPNSLADKIPLENQLTYWSQEEIEYFWKKLKKNSLHPTGKISDWIFIFNKLAESGKEVVIASFCGFRFVIEKFLQDHLKLSSAVLEKIKIEAWLPSDQRNKNLHLDHIVKNEAGEDFSDVENFRLTEEERIKEYEKIWLIDDSKNNTDAVLSLLQKNKDPELKPTDHVLNVLPANDNTPQIIMLWLQQSCEINFGFNSY